MFLLTPKDNNIVTYPTQFSVLGFWGLLCEGHTVMLHVHTRQFRFYIVLSICMYYSIMYGDCLWFYNIFYSSISMCYKCVFL